MIEFVAVGQLGGGEEGGGGSDVVLDAVEGCAHVEAVEEDFGGGEGGG